MLAGEVGLSGEALEDRDREQNGVGPYNVAATVSRNEARDATLDTLSLGPAT